jgi:tetratricopeptide (TPR) repeat protein
MTRLARGFFEGWERSALIALLMALLLLIGMLLAAVFAPSEWRTITLISAGGLLIIAQVIFMWGSRGLVSTFTQAQRAYQDGDFETTCRLLEDLRNRGKADADALTLLGNAYRQQGLLDESEVVLREALAMRPRHYFPLYGFGRTLLAKGLYDEAGEAIEKSLHFGAPPVVQCDLGEIYYRRNLPDKASLLLKMIRPQLNEPHRTLMADFLLFQMGVGESPALELVEAGLPYWQASSERFRHTPYGLALSEDVRWMLSLKKEFKP